MRRPSAEWLIPLASALAFFGAAEVTLRLAGYGAEPPLSGPMYVRNATRGYDLKPGYRGAGERSPYLAHPPISINSLGLRGPEIEPHKAAGVFRILCLGDSYMFGWGVEADEAMPARLEALLAVDPPGGRSPQALNGGVPAYGTGQELDLLLEKGLGLDPDVVLLGYTLNDALPGNDRRPHLDLPFKSVLRRTAVWRFLGRLYQQGVMLALAEATPAAKIDDILAYERENTSTLESGRTDVEESRARSVETIAAISAECRRRAIPFLVAIFPNRYQVEEPSYSVALFNAKLTAELEARGVQAIDLFAVFKREGGRAPLFLSDTHPNAAGHDLAARAVTGRISALADSRDGGLP